MKLLEKTCAALTVGLVLSIPYFAFAAPGQWLLQTGGAQTAAPTGITLVHQEAYCAIAYPNTTSTETCTLDSTAAGNTLVVPVYWCDTGDCSSGTATSLSSLIACSGAGPCSSGDTCTAVANTMVVVTGAGQRGQIWICSNVSAGDTAITATWSTAVGIASLNGSEYSHILTSAAPEYGGATAEDVSSGTSSVCTLGAATAETGDLVIAFANEAYTGNGSSVDSPFTMATSFGWAYYIDPSASDTPVATFRFNATTNRFCNIAAFKHD